MNSEMPSKSTEEMFFFVDSKLRLQDWNAHAANYFGFDTASKGKSVKLDSLPFNYKEVFKEAFFKKQTSEMIFPYSDSSNNTELKIKIIPSVKGLAVFASFIAELDNQSYLKNNELLYHSVLDNLIEGCSIFDFNWKCLYANDVTSGWLNLSKEQFVGSRIFDIAPGIETTSFFETYNYTMQNRVSRKIETNYTLHNGSRHWFESSSIPVPQGILIRTIDITKRKIIEEELRNLATTFGLERAKLAATIENLPMGIAIGDPNGRILSFNKAGLDLHGFASEEEMFSRLEDYVKEFELRYPDGSPMPVTEWPAYKAIRGEFVKDYETLLINKVTNTLKVILYSVAPVKDNEGKIILFVYVMQDLTDSKRIEKALLESEEHFRTLADNISQLAWMADSEGNIFWYNKRWYDYTGTTLEEMKDSGWNKVHDPLYAESVIEKFNLSIREGTPWEDIFPLRSKDGEYRWFLSRALPVYGKSGDILSWFGTNTDITEQKLLEEKLCTAVEDIKENQGKFERAENLAHIGSWVYDLRTGVIETSEEYKKIHGLKYATWDQVVKVIHPNDRERIIESRRTAYRENRHWENEMRIIRNDNEIRYLYLFSTPDFGENGEVIKRYGATIDITERKLAELKLEESLAKLKENEAKLLDANIQVEERLREKDVLLRELYHRTKNNMQIISSLLGLKASLIENDELKDVFDDMRSRIRAIALVHEKLYQSNNLSKVNLAEYIKDLVTPMVYSLSIPDKIKLKLDLDPIQVLIDTAVPCGLIVTELALNSLKHAFPGNQSGNIELSLKKYDDQRIRLIIADDGVGYQAAKVEIETLGLQLFRTIAEEQLDAEIFLCPGNGVRWSIIFKDSLYKERV